MENNTPQAPRNRLLDLLRTESRESVDEMRRECAGTIEWYARHLPYEHSARDLVAALTLAITAGQHASARRLAQMLAVILEEDDLPYCWVRESVTGDEVTARVNARGAVRYVLDEASEHWDARAERQRTASEMAAEQAMDDHYSGYTAGLRAEQQWQDHCAQAGLL